MLHISMSMLLNHLVLFCQNIWKSEALLIVYISTKLGTHHRAKPRVLCCDTTYKHIFDHSTDKKLEIINNPSSYHFLWYSLIMQKLEPQWKSLIIKLKVWVICNPSLPITRDHILQLHPLLPTSPTHLEPQVYRTLWWVRHVPHCAIALPHAPPFLAILLNPKGIVN